MSYSIPSYTKILTLAAAPFLFILVGVLSACEFAMVPGEYIFLCTQEEEVHSSSSGHKFIYTFSRTIIKKIYTLVCHYIVIASSLLN